MNAVKYLRTKRRMCGTYPKCMGCPMAHETKYSATCSQSQLEDDFPEKAVEIVEKWSKDNPRDCYGCFGASFGDCASCPVLDVNCYEQCKEQNNE